MSRYFFDVKNGHRLVDPAGLECRNDKQARDHALLIARQITVDAPASEGRQVAILNNVGEEVGKVPINESGKEKIMANKSIDKELRPEDLSHKPAKHIEETARLASSVDKDKDPAKVRGIKD